MKKVTCPSCFTKTTEADTGWDEVIATGKCPKCSTPIPKYQLSPEGVVEQGNVQSQSQTVAEKKIISSVVVVDIQMPFGSMVTFMVKWVLASIPAIVILFVIGVFLASIFGVLGLALNH
jgi:hypothetical protein